MRLYKELFKGVILLLSSIAIFLILLEGGLRIVSFVRSDSTGSNPEKIVWENEYKFYEYDSLLGWRNKAGSKGVFRTPDTVTEVYINSKGLRDVEHEYARDDRFRILVLGDSFTWGYGLNQQDRFTDVLQSLLGNKAEVINAGVAGYGTDQEMLFLKTEGVKYSPDLVILAFSTFDAIFNNISSTTSTYPKPYFELIEEKLSLQNVPVPKREYEWDKKRFELERIGVEKGLRDMSAKKRFKKFLKNNFKSYAFISDGIKGIRRAIKDAAKSDRRTYEDMVERKMAARKDPSFILTEEIAKELNSVVKSSNAELAVLMVTYRGHIAKFPDTIYYNMLAFCRSHDIGYIDPYTALFNEYKKGVDLFFEHDEHWNKAANRVVAREIYDYLTGRNLIR